MYDPELYQTHREPADRLNEKYIPKLRSAMSWNYSKGNILDYGCGPGFIAQKYLLPLAEATDSQIYAVDISPKMVEYAKNNFHDARIHHKEGSFPDNFPFGDVQFDTIFSIHVLCYVQDIKGTLQGMMDVLKPGGQLAFTTSTVNIPFFETLRKVGKSPAWKEYLGDIDNHYAVWSADAANFSHPKTFFRKVFIEETGFKEVLFEYCDYQSELDTDSLVALFESMNPLQCRVPEHLLDQLREDYRRTYTSHVGVPYDSKVVPTRSEYLCAVLEKPMLT